MNQEQFQQLFTVMQQQQQALTEANSILRQELSDQSTRFAAAQTQSDRNMAAMLEAMSPDKSIGHSGVLPPNRYPKLDDFKLATKDDVDARTIYYVHRQAWASRMQLEGDYKYALLEMKLKRDRHRQHGDHNLQASDTAVLKNLKDAYENVIFRKPPCSSPRPMGGTKEPSPTTVQVRFRSLHSRMKSRQISPAMRTTRFARTATKRATLAANAGSPAMSK